MAGESETYGNLLARLREMLMDQGHGRANALRWKDEELLRYLFAGVTALEKIRPAVRYQGMRLVDRVFPLVEPTQAQIDEATAGMTPAEAEAAETALRLATLESAKLAPVLVERHFHEGIVHYAAYRALQMDENDATPAYRSNMHHKRFEEIARS